VPIMKIATASDEAMALLLLENSETRWMAEYGKREKGEKVVEKDLPVPLYTSAGQSNKQQKGFTKRYGGWSQDGINRFNQVHEMVKQDRQANGFWFDELVKKRIEANFNSNMDESGVLDGSTQVALASNDLGYDDDVVVESNQESISQVASV